MIDDEVGARSALRAILEGRYSVLLFARGEEAADFVRNAPGRAEAAFVDFTMPGMDGAAVCRLLATLDPSLALIGITGTAVADFKVPLFSTIHKRGVAIDAIRETAASAVTATSNARQVRGSVAVPPPAG